MSIRDGRTIELPGLHPDGVEIPAKRWETGACFANPDGAQQYIVFGSPIHYHDGTGWQPIDTRWQAGVAPWNYQMTAAQYHAYALRRFDAGRIVRLEKSGHYVTYQPMALNWSNDLDQIQQIAIPQNVQGAVTKHGADSLVQGGDIKWLGAYGTGLDFTYTPSTHFFQKMLAIDTLANLGTPEQYILDGGNPCLQMSFVFASDLDLWVDGAKWDKKTKKDTASIVEFKDAAGIVHWWWRVPSATDANAEWVQGALRLKKQGASLYVSVQIPWSWLVGAVYPVRIDPATYYGETTDGYIYGYGIYVDARATSTSFNTSYTSYLYVGQDGGYYVYRGFLEFDTSGIDDSATITQANLYLTASYDASTTDFTLRAHEYNWTSPIAAGNQEANYDGALAATVNAVDWRSTSGMSIDIAYPSSNLRTAWINKLAGEWTKYALLSIEDVNNSEPGSPPGEWITIYPQEATTQAYRPYLSITVEAAGPTNYPRSCAMAMGVAGSGARTRSVVRACAVSMGAVGGSGRGYGGIRAGEVAIGLAGTGSRIRSVLRTGAADLGLVGTGSRLFAGIRSCVADIGLVSTSSRVRSVLRNCGVAIGNTATATRVYAGIRAVSVALGMTGTVSIVRSVLRDCAVGVGNAAIAARLYTASRIASAEVGVVGAVSRLYEGTRACAATIGTAATATRIYAGSRVAAATIGLAGTADRIRSVLREGAAAIGNAATAVRLYGASRTAVVGVGITDTALRVRSVLRGAAAVVGMAGTGIRVYGAIRTGAAYIAASITVTAVRKAAKYIISRFNRLFGSGIGPD